jgi:hypothetical protein
MVLPLRLSLGSGELLQSAVGQKKETLIFIEDFVDGDHSHVPELLLELAESVAAVEMRNLSGHVHEVGLGIIVVHVEDLNDDLPTVLFHHFGLLNPRFVLFPCQQTNCFVFEGLINSPGQLIVLLCKTPGLWHEEISDPRWGKH